MSLKVNYLLSNVFVSSVHTNAFAKIEVKDNIKYRLNISMKIVADFCKFAAYKLTNKVAVRHGLRIRLDLIRIRI